MIGFLLLMTAVEGGVNKRETTLCARMFEHSWPRHGSGWRYDINASRTWDGCGHAPGYYTQKVFIDCNWWRCWGTRENDSVSYMEVQPGCRIETYCDKWSARMGMWHGRHNTNFVRSWNDCITSYKCWCGAGNKPGRRLERGEGVMALPEIQSLPAPKEEVENLPVFVDHKKHQKKHPGCDFNELATCITLCTECQRCLAKMNDFGSGIKMTRLDKMDCLDDCSQCAGDCRKYYLAEDDSSCYSHQMTFEDGVDGNQEKEIGVDDEEPIHF